MKPTFPYWFQLLCVLYLCSVLLNMYRRSISKKNKRKQIPASSGQLLVHLIEIAKENQIEYTNILLENNRMHLTWENDPFHNKVFEADATNYLGQGSGYGSIIHKFSIDSPYMGYKQLNIYLYTPAAIKKVFAKVK